MKDGPKGKQRQPRRMPASRRADADAPRAAEPSPQASVAPEREGDVGGEPASPPLAPGLHLLATPIGTAADLSLRGRAALREADVLAAEDTRVLRRLLDLHGVALAGRPLLAYHDHNAAEARPALLGHLAAGARVVYASDAGTPLIADPGWRLAKEARAAGARVSVLPGPCAAIAALVLSGLPTDAFAFLGFPPPRGGARRTFFEAWRAAPASLILYEAPHRLGECLEDLAATLGVREAAVVREITKRFEETRVGRLDALAAAYAAEGPPKGEIVIVIGPPQNQEPSDAAIDAALRSALTRESARDAARTVAELLGTRRKRVYDRVVEVSRGPAACPDKSSGDAVERDDTRPEDARREDARRDGSESEA